MEKEKIKKTIEEYRKYAEKNGFRLNPDKRFLEAMIKSLLEIEKKHGKRYCCCRKLTGEPKIDAKIICPCQYHKTELDKLGRCLCGLFVK